LVGSPRKLPTGADEAGGTADDKVLRATGQPPISYEDRDSESDAWSATFGANPRGIVVYHQSGVLSVQIAATADWRIGSDDTGELHVFCPECWQGFTEMCDMPLSNKASRHLTLPVGLMRSLQGKVALEGIQEREQWAGQVPGSMIIRSPRWLGRACTRME